MYPCFKITKVENGFIVDEVDETSEELNLGRSLVFKKIGQALNFIVTEFDEICDIEMDASDDDDEDEMNI